jgi:hypothetical protein
VQEVLSVIAGDFQPDPRRGEGRELAKAHHAIFRAKLALEVLEYKAEKEISSARRRDSEKNWCP